MKHMQQCRDAEVVAAELEAQKITLLVQDANSTHEELTICT